MRVKEGLAFVFLATLLTIVTSTRCPPDENLSGCYCSTSDDAVGVIYHLVCVGHRDGPLIADLKEMLQQNFAGKGRLDIKFERFNHRPGKIPSNLFQGLRVTNLKFDQCNIQSWVDEEGGPVFVGLEQSLEHLTIHSSIKLTRKHRDYKNERAPFTLGHLLRLKTVDISMNTLWNFGNEWFGEGGNSVEILDLTSNNIYELGDQAFASLPNLKKLKLRTNNIIELQRRMLPNPALNLVELDFGSNMITDKEMDKDMFANMPSLEVVHFIQNNLIRLRERTWKPIWSQLTLLDLEDNAIYCGEIINWMYRTRSPQHLIGECLSPADVQHKKLSELIEENGLGAD